MNHYYIEYQKNNFKQETPLQWKKYGIQSFKNLLYFLGYPAGISLDVLDPYLSYEQYGPGTTIQEQGILCDRFFFIIQGNVKITSAKNGVTATQALFNEGNIVGSLFDFLEHQPASDSLETRSSCHLLCLTKTNFDAVAALMDSVGLNTVLQTLTQNFLKYIMWFQGYQTLPALERIKDLHQKYPEIILNFKDDDVASFLGLTRETYSRLKKHAF